MAEQLRRPPRWTWRSCGRRVEHDTPARSKPKRRRSPPRRSEAHSSTELLELHLGKAADAPLCMTCGTKMRPAGSLLRLRGLRLHQRLQLSVPGAPPRLRARRGTGVRAHLPHPVHTLHGVHGASGVCTSVVGWQPRHRDRDDGRRGTEKDDGDPGDRRDRHARPGRASSGCESGTTCPGSLSRRAGEGAGRRRPGESQRTAPRVRLDRRGGPGPAGLLPRQGRGRAARRGLAAVDGLRATQFHPAGDAVRLPPSACCRCSPGVSAGRRARRRPSSARRRCARRPGARPGRPASARWPTSPDLGGPTGRRRPCSPVRLPGGSPARCGTAAWSPPSTPTAGSPSRSSWPRRRSAAVTGAARLGASLLRSAAPPPSPDRRSAGRPPSPSPSSPSA